MSACCRARRFDLIDNHTQMSKTLKSLSDDDMWKRWNERLGRVRQELHYVYGTRSSSFFEELERLLKPTIRSTLCWGWVWS